MMKVIRQAAWIILIALLIAGAAIFLLKEPIIKSAIKGGFQRVFGLSVDFKTCQVTTINNYVALDITDLKVYNPPGFPDRVMLDIPKFYARGSLQDFLKGDLIFLELRMDIRAFQLVRNADASTNIGCLKGIARPKAAEVAQEKKHNFKIDLLRLRMGHLTFKDYTTTPPLISIYILNLDKEFYRVSDALKFVRVVVVESLLKAKIDGLMDVPLSSLKRNVDHVMRASKDLVLGITSRRLNK